MVQEMNKKLSLLMQDMPAPENKSLSILKNTTAQKLLTCLSPHTPMVTTSVDLHLF